MSTSQRVPRQSLTQIFLWPIGLALMSIAGLWLGLTGDGWRDTLASALLALPIFIFLWRWTGRPKSHLNHES